MTLRRTATGLLIVLLGACSDRPPIGPVVPPPVAVRFTGAGNIASCTSETDESTAQLLDATPGEVFTLGDNAFGGGSAADYADCYGPTWGRHLARTRAVLGNHDYDAGHANAAYDYFGARVGPRGLGYYSYDLGSWHIVVLNDAGEYRDDNPYSPWSGGSAQDLWLRADLAANTKPCLAALWHVPYFFSSNTAGSVREPDKRILWEILFAAGADIVLNGQPHHYERMAPMRPDGVRDDALGIRQFNVGTGGGHGVLLPTVEIHPQSEVRAAAVGVLSLTLRADGYDWRFLPAAGGSFTDAGSASCH